MVGFWEDIDFSLGYNFNEFTKNAFKDLLIINNFLKKDILLCGLTDYQMDNIFSIMKEEQGYVVEVLLDMYYYLLENEIIDDNFFIVFYNSNKLLQNKKNKGIDDIFYSSCSGLSAYIEYFITQIKRENEFFVEKLDNFNFTKMNKGFIYDILESLNMFLEVNNTEEAIS